VIGQAEALSCKAKSGESIWKTSLQLFVTVIYVALEEEIEFTSVPENGIITAEAAVDQVRDPYVGELF
jgi:hypothetical protein